MFCKENRLKINEFELAFLLPILFVVVSLNNIILNFTLKN